MGATKNGLLSSIYRLAERLQRKYNSNGLTQVHIVAGLLEQYRHTTYLSSVSKEMENALNELCCTKENANVALSEAVKWLKENPEPDKDEILLEAACYSNAVEIADILGCETISLSNLIRQYTDVPGAALRKVLSAVDNGELSKNAAVKNEKINELLSSYINTKNETDNPEDSSAYPSERIIPFFKDLQNNIRDKVYGQDEAISAVVSGYFDSVVKSNNDSKNQKPQAVFLFAGAPGVGKTFLANTAADALKLPFRRFDMSSFSDDESPHEFSGSDRVYKNSHEGLVTGFVKAHPRCVLLFDEIEKAHLNIIHLFLQILDAGWLKDAHLGENISFKDTIIIMTTNAGKNLYQNLEPGGIAPNRKTVINAIANDVNPVTGQKFFPEAICSRFAAGNVILFNPLSTQDLLKISNSVMKSNIELFEKNFNISFDFDDNLCAALLFAEGGKIDARALSGRTSNFISEEIFNWMRFASEKNREALSATKKIKIRIDTKGNHKELFKPSGTQNVLLFSENPDTYAHLKSNKRIKLFNAKTIAQAYEIINDKDISFSVCDIFGTEAPTLNVEDTQSEGRRLLDILVNERIPTFIYSSDKHKINREERQALTENGARGFFEQQDTSARLKEMGEDAHIEKMLHDLIRSKKALTYDCIYDSEGDIGIIELSDLRLVPLIDVDDSDAIDDVCMTNTTFDSIIGAEDAKEELKGFISYLKEPKLYTRNNIPVPKGIVLYGPPGTGKTMLAKAFAHESGATFIATQGNDFLSPQIGGGAQKVKRIFELARKYAPAVVFIDEFDIIAKDRFTNRIAEDTVNALLNEMDGFSTNSSRPVFVLAATNFNVAYGQESALDGALLRRFDRRIFVDLPNADERKVFIEKRLKSSKQTLKKSAIKNIASRSIGMSLADLSSVIDFALRSMLRAGLTQLSEDFFNEAFETYRFGEKNYWSEELLRRVAIHESGHALLSYLNGTKPSYITISSRGSFGGYVHTPAEEERLYTKNQLLLKIRGLLAGRAAELIFYGNEDGISTGAATDIATATRIALQMITVYGMVEEYGIMATNKPEAADGLCNEILANELENAKTIIRENKPKLEKLVKTLLEKNHLMGDKIEEFFENA